jgi:hypothetical protein
MNTHLFPVKVKEKWGFINHKGEVIIEPKYELVKDFSCSLAGVLIDNMWGFIGSDSQFKIPPKFPVGSCRNFSEDLLYVNTVGFIDTQGEIAIPQEEFDWAMDFQNGFALIRKDEKFGYIDKNGNIVLKPEFQHGGNFSEGFFPIMQQNFKWRFIDKEKKILGENEYDFADMFSEGLSYVESEGKPHYINLTGKTVIDSFFF